MALSEIFGFFLFFIFAVILIFYVWMFVDCMLNKKVRKTEKALWIILFIITSLLTAIIWWFVRKGR